MTAQDYPITTPYGYVKGYPLNNGFHKGEDRAAPLGTPILVNGIQIGLVGSSGMSTGNHCHIGKFLGDVVQPPKGGGFNLVNPKVIFVGEDSKNGKHVKIESQGYTWYYLHLSVINVKEGALEMLTAEEVDAFWQGGFNARPTTVELAQFTGRKPLDLALHILKYNEGLRTKYANYDATKTALDEAYKQIETLSAGSTKLKKGLYEVE